MNDLFDNIDLSLDFYTKSPREIRSMKKQFNIRQSESTQSCACHPDKSVERKSGRLRRQISPTRNFFGIAYSSIRWAIKF